MKQATLDILTKVDALGASQRQLVHELKEKKRVGAKGITSLDYFTDKLYCQFHALARENASMVGRVEEARELFAVERSANGVLQLRVAELERRLAEAGSIAGQETRKGAETAAAQQRDRGHVTVDNPVSSYSAAAKKVVPKKPKKKASFPPLPPPSKPRENMGNRVSHKVKTERQKAAAERPVSPAFIVRLGEKKLDEAKKDLYRSLAAQVKAPRVDLVKGLGDKLLVKTRDADTSVALQKLTERADNKTIRRAIPRWPKVIIKNVERELSEVEVLEGIQRQNDLPVKCDELRLAYRTGPRRPEVVH